MAMAEFEIGLLDVYCSAMANISRIAVLGAVTDLFARTISNFKPKPRKIAHDHFCHVILPPSDDPLRDALHLYCGKRPPPESPPET